MLTNIVFQNYLHENREEKMSDESQRFRFFGNALAQYILNEFHYFNPPFDRVKFFSIVLVKKRADNRVIRKTKSIDVILERKFEDLLVCQDSQKTSELFFSIIQKVTDLLDIDESISADFLVDGLNHFIKNGFETSWCLHERRPRGLNAVFRLEARMTTDFLEVFFVAIQKGEEDYRERVMLTIPSDRYLEGNFKRIIIEDDIVSIPGTIASYDPYGSLNFDVHPTLSTSKKLNWFQWSRPLSDILSG